MRFFRRCHRELDARVTDARNMARDARKEVSRSQARYESARDTVMAPLHKAADDNQFSDMLRQSLIEGYGGRR